jgi:hypothetical protein
MRKLSFLIPLMLFGLMSVPFAFIFNALATYGRQAELLAVAAIGVTLLAVSFLVLTILLICKLLLA